MATQLLPTPFTADDYLTRMARMTQAALDTGMGGVVIAPGPDLVWLTGYEPTALTERLTLLVLTPKVRPMLLVPTLERPDAEAALETTGVGIVDWHDSVDPYHTASAFLRAGGVFGISDATWASHLLGLQEMAPSVAFRGLSESLPMLRAVKDA